MSLALYRKWRPMTFSDVVGQPQVTDTLKKQIALGRLSHAYLFTGTRGTGKTTCAKLLAKAANCQNLHDGEPCNECAACRAINDGAAVDVSEIDAASNSGVDNIRSIRDQAAYTPVELKYRVYIIDECHMLSGGAWNALLKTLEEPPEHVIFILATTELGKIPPTILSRCQRYSFRRGSARDLAARVSEIAAAEGIPLTEDGAAALARLADGGFRDAISMLDQCASARQGATLDEAAILDELGLASADDTLSILQSTAQGDVASALATLDKLYSAGKDMSAFLGELGGAVRDELILLTTKAPALLGGRYAASALESLGLTASAASAMLAATSDAQARLARTASARTEVELCIVKLASIAAGGISDEPQPVRVVRAAQSTPVAQPKPTAPVAEQPKPAATTVTSAQDDDTPPWDEAPSKPIDAPRVDTAAAPEDAPPWDDVPPIDDSFAPPLTDEPTFEPQPAPRKVSDAPKQAASASWWQDVMADARPNMPISHYMQLAAQPTPAIDGDTVVITVTSEFARKIVGDRQVLGAVESSAAKVLGRKVSARCVLAGQEKIRDAFDDLLEQQTKFDNFTITD